MAVFPDEDRVTYPDMFALPTGCYEVVLPRPLGIAFEEHEPGRGVVVEYLVEDSHAEKCGQIQPGDVLIAVTAHKACIRLSICRTPLHAHLPTYLSLHLCLPAYPYHSTSLSRSLSLSTPNSHPPTFQAPSAMSRHERKLIPCRTLDFDTIMGAIGTNTPPRCKDVVLQFMRPSVAEGPTALIIIDRFLEFFEVPLDHVFRKN